MAGDDVLVNFSMVEKTYDGATLVIKNIDLDIHRGEFVTLLGPSGSGKTTTLMMLAGFETPTSGEITLNGRSINTLPPHRRNIGMVFQNYALFPHMTVEQNVAFPLEVRKVTAEETRRKVAEALDMVRLGDFGKRRPAQLSGGQQQRVALARALVFNPELVLMDEPLGALDKQLREHMQIEIKHLQKKLGITVVYVTHDQSEALTMSDRVAVFHDGVIQQIAPPDALYERPRNSFVANFIGENNNFSGELETTDGDRCTVRLANGDRLGARRVNVRGTGMPTSVSLRPERLFIGEPPAAGVNRLAATVSETIYFGDHVRVVMEAAGQSGLIARMLPTPDRPVPTPGDAVPVWFWPEDCRSLDPVRKTAEDA
ncbi:Spermidine/putrescine import ATP-binding protein PotA [uncultured Pleomorphomonas sp.]|uniref:Spermidine/putrescine import ATP-binding protein PotA n=1 Tax=uncultured Pleomorphomonas sp. TaxID=442121 RepID=A0A212LFX1_9HYPH|nr:ABC transporter ATP-binding protein [uncultured Pleomorphomonas sp.]SCM76462.1 Spermidine/putrescine import ATP-binding protein PotA [uncultured Pleomorphomonas sp.]